MIIWSPGLTLADIEKQIILKAYSWYGMNKTSTASSLGITARTLDHKLEEYLGKAAITESHIEKLTEAVGEPVVLKRGRPKKDAAHGKQT